MTTTPVLTTNDVFQARHTSLKLEWLAGGKGSGRRLVPASARYPGMALVGYLNIIHPNRVQVLGSAEIDYLDDLASAQRNELLSKLFYCPAGAMIIIADGIPAADSLIRHADQADMPLFSSPLASARLIDSLQYFLAHALAERTTLHGVFMEVMGIGVLLTGQSGIGKSEVALELLSRNHRLIADDAVEVSRLAPDVVEAGCPDTLVNFMEVRGLGILDIRAMFGETAIIQHKWRLDLIVRFEPMDKRQMQEIDRLQAEKQVRAILGIEVPEVVLFVAPGRNLAVLIEAATRRHIQHLRGINPLDELMARQEAAMRNNVAANEDTGSKG